MICENEWVRPIAVTGEIDYIVPTVPSIVWNDTLATSCFNRTPTHAVLGLSQFNTVCNI